MPQPIFCPSCGEVNFVAEDLPLATQVCSACRAPIDGKASRRAPTGSVSPPDSRLENPYASPVSSAALLAAQPRSRAGDQARRSMRWVGSMVDGFAIIPILLAASSAADTFRLDFQNLNHRLSVPLGSLAVLLCIQSVLMATRGQSLGKVLLGMKVVNLHDENIPDFYRGVILRVWFQKLLCAIPGYALLDALFIFGLEERCLHDYMAATRVITTR
jgi:uncharacterized RDD family membrane protein YckC